MIFIDDLAFDKNKYVVIRGDYKGCIVRRIFDQWFLGTKKIIVYGYEQRNK